MRLLLLSPFFNPDPLRAGTIQQLAQELAERGHQVDVLSIGRDDVLPAGPFRGKDDNLRAFVLGSVPGWAPKRGMLKYVPTVWRSHMNRRLRAWLGERYDGMLIFTPGLMSAGLGQRLHRSGIVDRTAFLLWDFFPVSAVESGAVHLGPAEGLAYRAERRIAAACDVLLPMSPSGEAFAKSYYRLPGATTMILPPWGSPVSGLEDLPKYERFTCAWGGQFIALRAIQDLIAAAQILEGQGFVVDFRLAGDGPLLSAYERQVRELGLRSVHFEGKLPRASYLNLLRRSHVALSVIEPMTSPCFPSKTVDYCQAGLPMVASVESCGDFGSIISEAGFGVSVPAGDSAGLAREIARLSTAPKGRLDAMSTESRRFFDEHLSVKVAAQTIERVYSSESAGEGRK